MSNKHKLKSITDEEFEVEEELLKKTNLLKNKTEDIIKVELSSQILKKVIEFLNIMKDEKINDKIQEPLPDKNLNEILDDKVYKFINDLPFEEIFELINAGAYLENHFLHDVGCAKIAHFMKGKDPEEINQHFTIECQLTNEEAKELGLDVDDDQN